MQPPSRRSVLLAGVLGLSAPGWLPAGASAPGQASDTQPLTDLERHDREHLLTVVTKEQALTPRDYAPPDLVGWRDTAYEFRAEVADQLQRLFRAAAGDDIDLRVISGYRSYQTQRETYASWVREYGRASADATSARPGHSEHQTGLAADLDSVRGGCYLDACFGDSAEGRWVARRAHRFGFILSYPQGRQDETGYVYEPWHIRYVGPHVARAMKDLGVELLPDYLSARYTPARLARYLGRQM